MKNIDFINQWKKRKKERKAEKKAQNDYKIIKKILEIEKIKKIRILLSKTDNLSNNKINYFFNNIQFNNNRLYSHILSDSFDLFDNNLENTFIEDIYDF